MRVNCFAANLMGKELLHAPMEMSIRVTLSMASVTDKELINLPMVTSIQATLPTDLGINDAEFLATVDDYGHILRWNISGTPHWEWAPGDPGSGMMQVFEVDPTGPGWHLYDGSSVSYLKSDGTLGGPITLPDLTSAGANAAYLKAGSPNAGVVAPVAPTITAEPVTGAPS